MGSETSAAQFPHGHIVIELSKSFYYSGTTVEGNVHVHLEQPFPATDLSLGIKGSEDVKWVSGSGKNRT